MEPQNDQLLSQSHSHPQTKRLRKPKFMNSMLPTIIFIMYNFISMKACLSFAPHSDHYFSSKKNLHNLKQFTPRVLQNNQNIFPKISTITSPSNTNLHLFNPQTDLDLSNNFWISSIIDSYSTSPYQFMFPTAILVATSCQLAGIGGAALFSPIFLLIFPFIGLELSSPAQAVASALLTEVFGFASGLFGFSRRGLVDWGIASQFMAFSIPSALIGAISAKALSEDILLLRVLYASLMIGLALFFILSPRPEAIELMAIEECDIPENEPEVRTLTAADGTEYTYLAKPSSSTSLTNAAAVEGKATNDNNDNGNAKGIGATLAGSTLTGLLGVGVGEVILPQLVRGRCMPLPVAAGTSVAVVVTTALTAAVIQFLSLAVGIAAPSDMNLGAAFVSVIPWNLVQFTIPGVLIGGQLAPLLASTGKFSDEQIEMFAASLFGVVGMAFATKAFLG